MIIKYVVTEENTVESLKIWEKYANISGRENRNSELFLYLLGLYAVWDYVQEETFRYISFVTIIIMLIALYFRSYRYKLMTEPAMLTVDTKDQTVMVDDAKYKIKKMLLECNYFFIFFKRKVVILDIDKLTKAQKQEIISLFD